MVWPPKKVNNSDPGNADTVGGNDWDDISDYHSGVDKGGSGSDINTFTSFRSGKLASAGYVDLTGITEPSSPASGKNRFYVHSTDGITKVKKSSGTVVSLEGGGAGGTGGGVSSTRVWTMYIDTADGDKVKATNGTTSYEDADDVVAVLANIFTNMGGTSGTTPFHINVLPGDYYVRDWPDNTFGRQGGWSMQGAGMGVTNFIITDDVGDISGHNGVFRFAADGGTSYASNSLSSNAAKHAATVTVSTNTDLVDNAYVVLGSDLVTTGAAKDGEINRVVRVTGSGPYTVVLEKRTRTGYNTANSAFIRRLKMVKDVTLKDFTIKGDPSFTNSTDFMRFDFGVHINVNNVELHNFGGGFHTCLITNCVIDSRFNLILSLPPRLNPGMDATTADGDFTNGHGYAFSCRGACESLYITMRSHGGQRHAFTTTANSETSKNGYPRNIHIVDSTNDTTGEQGFDTHGEGDGIYFERCSVYSFRNANGPSGTDDTAAFSTRARNTIFRECDVQNNWGVGVGVSVDSPGCKVDNCYIRNIVDAPNNAMFIEGANCQITDNFIEDCDGSGIVLAGGADDAIVSGNKIINMGMASNAKSGITLQSGAARAAVNGNNIRDCRSSGIKLEGTNDDTVFNNNVIYSCGQEDSAAGIKVTDSQNCVGTGNRIVSCHRNLEMTGTSDRLVFRANNIRANDNGKITVGANNDIGNNIE